MVLENIGVVAVFPVLICQPALIEINVSRIDSRTDRDDTTKRKRPDAMTSADKAIAAPLRFKITAPIGMGLSKGETRSRKSPDVSPWLRFSLCPPDCPDRQVIFLTPEKGERQEQGRPSPGGAYRHLLHGAP